MPEEVLSAVTKNARERGRLIKEHVIERDQSCPNV